MGDLQAKDSETALREAAIAQLEEAMAREEQVDCPVIHRTGNGLYMREVTMYAGTLAIGHAHKVPAWNDMFCGRIAIPGGGGLAIIEGPLSYQGKVGSRKVGYVLETAVWRNTWPNPDNETDIEVLEARYLDKSEESLLGEAERLALESVGAQVDRDDYEALLSQYGFDEETVRSQSENEGDQIEMPSEWMPFTAVRKSPIEGRGLFLNWPLNAGDVVAPARIGGKRTPAGRYVNHSATPNCHYVESDKGDIYLVASRPIAGCRGGGTGEELTVSYRQALSISGIEPKGGQKCRG